MSAPDKGLKEFATARQWEVYAAVCEGGSFSAAARDLGISRQSVTKLHQAIFVKAARRGYSPAHDMTAPVADGFKLARHSQYYDGNGNPANKWVIATPDTERAAILREAVAEALACEVVKVEPTPAPATVLQDLLNTYVVTDFHLGMLAWDKVSGAPWSLKIGSKVLRDCFRAMLEASPAAAVGLLAQLGDFLHSDSLRAVTPRHGHILDQGNLFEEIAAEAAHLLRDLVLMALEKHDRVHVIMAEGNHDEASSVWLRTIFKMVFADEPRVTVDTSPVPYYVYQHGEVMLAYHHGHLKTPSGLPGQFAAQFPSEWGASKHRYGNAGHMHSREVFERDGMQVTQHPTLAPRDNYAVRGGWHSDRSASSETFHKKFGRIGEVQINPAMFAPV